MLTVTSEKGSPEEYLSRPFSIVEGSIIDASAQPEKSFAWTNGAELDALLALNKKSMAVLRWIPCVQTSPKKKKRQLMRKGRSCRFCAKTEDAFRRLRYFGNY